MEAVLFTTSHLLIFGEEPNQRSQISELIQPDLVVRVGSSVFTEFSKDILE